MDIQAFIKELMAKEITLWSEDGKLKFRAPKGATTEEIRNALKENKEAIIAYLEQVSNCVFETHMSERFEKFPLTDIQNSYVIGRNNMYELGGVACHGYLEIVFEEEIDIERMELAWNKVIQKHDMLRAIIYDVGYQVIQRTVPYVKIRTLDLRNTTHQVAKDEIREELANKQYNLGEWPMCDLGVSIEKGKSIVYFSVDMLIADFLSMNIILNDLEKFYKDLDTPMVISTLYRDLVVYQNNLKLMNRKERSSAEIYWENKMPTMGEAPELPVINKMNLKAHSFTQHKMFLDGVKWKNFCKIAKENNVTPSVLVMSALAETVAVWSSTKKFAINTTFFNRPQVVEDIDEVVGDFTDVNILSVDFDFNKTFVERIKIMQEDLWADIMHSAISGVEVLRRLTKERKKNIVMPVVFTSTVGIAREDDATVRRTMKYKISQTPQVYIDCQVSDENGGAKINWDVRDGVFEEHVIQDMFACFTQLVEAIESRSEEVFEKKYPIELPESTVEVRRRINATEKEIAPLMMEEGFLNALRAFPEKAALITEGRTLTYAVLAQYVKTIVDVLKEKEVTPGERIGINIDKNEWQIAAVLATLLMKATYVPIDVRQPNARKQKIINSANIRILLSEDEEIQLQQVTNNINVRSLNLSEEQLGDFIIDQAYDRPAYIIFTSGTTGEPKGVVMTHRAAMNTICDVNAHYNIGEEDIFLGLANLSFDLSVYDIFGCYLAGGTLVLPNSHNIKDPKYLYDLILLHRVTIWNSVPAQAQMIANYLESVDIRKSQSLRVMILSGDWIPVNLPDRIHNAFPNVHMVSKGGATEAAIWSIYYDIARGEVFEKSVPYGKPMANQKFYVLDENLQHCPNYVEGNLYIAGTGLSVGYLNDDKMNAEKYPIFELTGERIYKTGDRGFYRADGMIVFKGRESGDEQVKIHGHRIELAEIRAALLEYSQIDSAVTLTVGNPPEELKINAVVAPKRRNIESKALIEDTEKEMLTKLCNDFEATVDTDLLEIWNRQSELVVISDIYNLFKRYGIFTELYKPYSLKEVIDIIKVPEKLHKLTKRWLKVLTDEGVLKETSEEMYMLIENESNLDSESLWKEFYEIENRFNYSKEFVDYLKVSSDVLPEMIQGNENPLNVLFPKGDVKPAMAAYHDNKINRIQNGVATEEIVYLCKQANIKHPEKTFRILEVGAGVGGTSLDVIPQLEGYNVEYHFTDLSTFFLNKAQENFSKYNFVKYGIFDINKSFSEQGYDAFSFDVILCANVLHNSRNVHDVMENLRHLLVDQGNIIVLEETRVSYMLLTSMEFKDGLTGFLDERQEDDQTFFTRAQWENIFSKHNGEIIHEFPSKTSKLDITGQTIYIARFKSEYEALEKNAVREHLVNTVSSYMVPSNILVVPSIPLTENKKVDMKKIKALIENSENNMFGDTSEKEMPQTDLEKQIAAIWCRELKIDNIGRDDDFYNVGGDSLLIAQVVGKIVEEIKEAEDWEWSALLTEMMQTPTVRELAEKIQRYNLDKSSFIDPSLVQIKNTKMPNEQSVAKVLFHAGTGTLSAYTDLISYIEKNSKDDESVLGFSFGNEAEYISMETKDTFKILGKKYGKILRQLGYSNYILIGHCVGGVIALEAAEYLRENGLKVSDVTLVSATIQRQKERTVFNDLPDEVYERALKSSLENELLLERTFAKLINANEMKAGYMIDDYTLEMSIRHIVKQGDAIVSADALCQLEGEFLAVAEEFRTLTSKPLFERLNNLYAAIERDDAELMEHERKLLNTLFNIFTQNFGCVANHKPRPYTGTIRIFTCEQQGASFFQEFFGEDFETWRPYIKGAFRADTLVGQHFDCIVGANLQKNIDKILDFIYE